MTALVHEAGVAVQEVAGAVQGTRLDVVIVNWNSGALLRDCLESLAEAVGTDLVFHVIVVDNASNDGSLDGCDSGGAFRCTVLRNDANRGFAAACNQGAAAGDAPFVLFLNPDTRVTAASLRRPVAFLESPDAGDVGICGVALTDRRGAVWRSCSYHPTPWRMVAATTGLDRLVPRLVRPRAMLDFDHRRNAYVDQVIGAFFVVRRPLFEHLGGFDERFFVYYEEVDFAYRAARAGARTYFLADTLAFHEGGGTTDRVRAFRQFLVARSRVQYADKHFPRALAVIHRAVTFAVEPAVRVAHSVLRGEWQGVRENARAAALLWRRGAGAGAPPAGPH